MDKLTPTNPPAQFKTWQFEPGCYVDSARGLYAVDLVISFAESLGFVPSDCDCEPCSKDGAWCDCVFSNEVEDEATDYLNERFEIVGHSWGRNENGDFGLWAASKGDVTTGEIEPL